MLRVYFRKYRNMLLCGILFFYLGCGLTMSLLKVDCSDVIKKTRAQDINSIVDPYSSVEYAVVILSHKHNKDERDTIRETWKRLASNIVTENGTRVYKWQDPTNNPKLPDFIRFYFVIGIKYMTRDSILALDYEREENQDVLLLDEALEGYTHLSDKMLKTMEWLSKNLKNLKYVIKCDDDSFVRVDLIVKDLEAYGPNLTAPSLAKYITYKQDTPSALGLYWGYFNGQAHVYKSGKWAEKEWFQCDMYLPYALGGGYVISQNIVHYIGNNANWLRPYTSEDVSMGLWTAALRGVTRVHDIRFDTEWKSRGCQNDMLIRHKQNESDIDYMYRLLLWSKGEKLCRNASEVRKNYLYKWDGLPSQCCK